MVHGVGGGQPGLWRPFGAGHLPPPAGPGEILSSEEKRSWIDERNWNAGRRNLPAGLAPNLPMSAAREEQINEFARRMGSRHVPMSAERKEQINEFARRVRAPNVPMSAAREEQLRKFVRRINGGSWDSAKHPRGGNPQNRGEFSVAGGAAGTQEPSAGRERASGASADQAPPRSPVYLRKRKNRPSRMRRTRSETGLA